jgi:hypothetical protein
MLTDQSNASKSLVRVKAILLFVIFTGCWLSLKFSGKNENLFLAISGVSAVLVFFIRCEGCKSSIYYQRGERRFPPFGLVGFLMAGQCPICGRRRA